MASGSCSAPASRASISAGQNPSASPGLDAPGDDAQGVGARGDLFEPAHLARRREIQTAPRRQQGMIREAHRRRVVEGAAAHREGADRVVAIESRPQRRRTSGGVIAMRALALEESHPRVRRETGRRRSPSDARADDQKVKARHAPGLWRGRARLAMPRGWNGRGATGVSPRRMKTPLLPRRGRMCEPMWP